VPVTLSTQCSWCILNGSICVMIRNLGLSVHGSRVVESRETKLSVQ
jgi:hypothetical protein